MKRDSKKKDKAEPLRLANQRLENILEGAGLGAWDWWLETNQVQFDRRWCEMLGLSLDATPQNLSTWDSRVHPADKAKAYEDIKAYLEGKTPIYENVHRLRHAEGHWVWILDRGRISQYNSQGKPIRFTGTHLDVSKFKETQMLLDSIQEVANIGGWELDVATGKTKWTSETYRIHAVPEGTPTDKIKGIEFYAPHERQRISLSIANCLRGVAFKEVFEFLDASGQKKWVRSSGEPVHDANGSIYKLRGTIQDVSKENENERGLEEAQRLAKIGSWTFDISSKDLKWSSEHYRIFEISEPQASDVLYSLYQERVHPEDIPAMNECLERALQSGEDFVFNHRVYLDHGNRVKYVRGIGKTIKDKTGKPVRLSGTCQDLTELIGLQDQNRFILDSMNIGIWKYNPITSELVWDESMYRLYDLNAVDFSGHYEAWSSSLSPETQKQAEEEINLALRGEKNFDTSFEIITKRGARKRIRARGLVVRNSSGDPILMYGLNWDISEEAKLQQELELERLKSIHNAKLASLGEMSAGIAHEINNPLAIISGSVRLLRGLDSNSEKFESKVNSIERSTSRIEKIVTGLRKFARISDGTIRKQESLKDIIQECIILTNPKAKQEAVAVRTDLEEDLYINCDLAEIEQVIVNLINNGIDAVKQQKEPWVNVRSFSNLNEAVIQVIDSGRGLSPEVESKLFQPFFTTKPVGHGTGLGLSISKGIIDQHQATLTLNRTISTTCFEIRFPKATPAAKGELANEA